MENAWLVRALLALLVAFVVALLLAPFVLRLAKRLKAGQPILCYVEQHAGKAGTPTFGGFIFLLPTVAATVIFSCQEGLGVGLIACFVMLSYAVLGFWMTLSR
ncbi:MAG TPA: hypothetical protein DCG79_02260 [Clostridiales bacterium]|nr:hypothetical protein [Clostridiales bacterium]